MRRFFLILVFLSLIGQAENVYSQSVYWRQIFGGEYVDIAYNCIELRDGNYMLAGYKEIQVPGQNYQIPKSYIVKIDRFGNILWEKIIGDLMNYNISYSLAEDFNENIYLTYFHSYAHLVKLNRNGEIIWDREYAANNIQLFRGLSFVNSYNFLVILGQNNVNSVLQTSSISKIDTNGNLIWNKAYSDSDRVYFSSNNSFLFNDDNYFIAGRRANEGFILKTDTSGNLIWDKYYPFSRNIGSLAKNSLNSYIASGQGNSALYCQLIDSNGNIIWKRDYNGDSLAGSIGGDKILKSKDNQFALGTPRGQNFGRLMLIDSLGNILKSKFYNYSGNVGVYQNNINFTSDSGFIASGYIRFYQDNIKKEFSDEIIFNNKAGDKLIDFLIFKIDKELNTVSIKNNNFFIVDDFQLNIFPNPFNLSFKISLNLYEKSYLKMKLYNISGKVVKNLTNNNLNIGSYEFYVESPELSSGIYFVNIEINENIYSKKILLIK